MAAEKERQSTFLQIENFSRAGRNIVNQFYIIMKTAQVHDPNNVAFVHTMENLIKTLSPMLKKGEGVVLSLKGDYLYFEDTRLKQDIEGFVSFNYVITELKKREIGSIIFKHNLDQKDLKKFIHIFLNFTAAKGSIFEAFEMQIDSAGITGIDIAKLKPEKEEYRFAEAETAKDVAKRGYFNAVAVTKEIMDNARLNQTINVRKAKRAVQSIVDLILQEEISVLGLTTIKNYDEYTYNHCVNVCVLSIALGQRLGFSKTHLSELGLAAVFHDIGKVSIPVDILHKPLEFNDEEWAMIRRHPVQGVTALLKMKGLNELAIKSMIVTFEHHLNFDLSGYPKINNKWPLNLFSKIVSIADCYDAMTSARVYNKIPFSPDKALSLMWDRANRYYDPLVLKVFINMLGVYPIGTLVILDSREMGLVFQGNPNPERLDRPKVILIADATGANRNVKLIADLSETDPATGKYKRSIVRAEDPKKFNVDVAEYFL